MFTAKFNFYFVDCYLTIRPVVFEGYGTIAYEAKPNQAIDLWPLKAKGLIVLVSPN